MKQPIRIIGTVLCLGLIWVLLLCGCKEGPEEEPEPSSTAVEVTTVKKSSISSENNVSGQVASGQQEPVFAPISARCTQVCAEVGDTVQEGQTLFTLDVSPILSNYETAVTNYENAQQNYQEQSALLSSQVAQAEQNVQTTQALVEAGSATQIELNSAQLALENAQAGMNATLGQLEASMQHYKSIMDQLDETLGSIDPSGNVPSPIAGTVMTLSVRENSMAAPGAPMAVIESNTNMQIKAGVAESLVSKLQAGGPVRVSIPSAKREFQGTIAKIDPSANPANHLYGVTIQIPADQIQGLLTGMFADVIFYTDTTNNAVIIPTEAIQVGTDGQYVYTVDDKNIAHVVPVKTGLVGNGVTEITAGLNGGETLVTVGQFYLSDGAAVRIVTPEA